MAGDLLSVGLRFFVTGAVGPCVVRSVSGTEHVSQPFRYRVDFLAQDVDLDRARGAEASLEITDAREHERFVHGVVEELSVRPTLWEGRHLYEAVVVPEAALLKHRHGFRAFQDLTVPEICRRVLSDAGLDLEQFEWRLSGAYEPRELCVQYDESEWDFVCRLLEAEGIWFRFEHRADGHTMIFGDDSSVAPVTKPNPLPFDYGHADFLDARAYDLDEQRSLAESRVSLDDYDDLRRSLDLQAEATTEEALDRQWYEWPGRYVTEATGRRLARVRLDELRWPHEVFDLKTTALEVGAGTRLVVVGAPTAIPDSFIVSSTLRITPAEEDDLASAGTQDRWTVSNDLQLIPDSQQFRPPRRTPRPAAHGLQTARVTGPPGQEIHLDEYGRVKVQFHWDRDAQLDEHASCWVPVAQGQTTGAIMHPRTGWEVVVEFRDANPDRPVVTGRVYNPFFPPPHALPERKTVTAHRSDSLPGRNRIHEVRFEDRAGDEHIAVTAGHDLREVAVVNRHVTVLNDENREVGVNRTETVGVLQTTVGHANHSDSVTLFQNVFVGQDRFTLVRRSASEQIQNDLRYDVGNMHYAQVGEVVPGRVQSMLRQSDEGPAYVLLDSLAPLLEQVREAAMDEATEGGPAQQLLEEEDPAASYTLGPVMGRLTRGPDSPPDPDHSDATCTQLEETVGEAGGEIGGVAEGATEQVDGAVETVGGAGGLTDGVGSAGGALGAAGESAAGFEGVTEGAADVTGGMEGFGNAMGDGSFFQDDGLLENVSGFLGELGATSEQIRRVSDQVRGVTRAAGEATALADQAGEVTSEIDGSGAVGALRSVSSANPSGGLGIEDGPPSTPQAEPGGTPLAFLDDVMGEAAGQSAWDVTEAVTGSIDTIIAGVSGLLDAAGFGGAGEGLPARDHILHPYEHNSVHFGAAVADAILRGELGEDDAESDEEDEGESSSDARADSESTGGTGSGSSAESSEDEQPAGQPPRGEGTWSFTVGGDQAENIAGVSVVGCGVTWRLGVGGQLQEKTRLARVEQVGGNRVEQTDGSKTESTGRYVVVAAEAVTISTAGTGRFVVGGDAMLRVGGAHTLEAGGDLRLEAKKVRLDGADTITFECGAARISISSDGISIEGTEIVVQGSTIGVDSPSLG